MHNAKFDMTGTENLFDFRFDDDYPFHDTFVLSNLIQNNHPDHKLKNLAWELAGITKDDEKAIKGYANYSLVPEYLMDEYQHQDAVRTMLLFRFFLPRMEKLGLQEIYETELKLERATMNMERHGIMLNIEAALAYIEELKRDAEKVLDDLERYCGRRINPHRDVHVRWLLYEFEKLPVLARTPKTGEPTTKKEFLLELNAKKESPAIIMLLKARSWLKGITTLKKYIELADEYGIIHPEIKTLGAKTGRESCKTPNLQNVAKATTLMNPFPIKARKVFRPRPGHINFHIDYAGIELRLLVHYSGDEAMVAELNKPDGDPHALAAETFYLDTFKKAKGARRKQLRDAAKNANFAIPYGASARQMSKTLGFYGSEAVNAYNRYRNRFPRLASFQRDIMRQVREQGHIKTFFGRILHIAPEKAYVGANYLIQGTAAGVLKRAQVRVEPFLRKETSGEVKPLLPIHDEIIIEYPRRRLKEAREIMKGVKNLMEDFHFKIPMEVEFDVATANWEDKKEFKMES
ncbi:MAG: hypothetical protein GTN39_03125 [Candidatus Aenigmarchaeota archaeon]|nr:hypothetical protein [Candidatus Aenigmarchaeota archaeon]